MEMRIASTTMLVLTSKPCCRDIISMSHVCKSWREAVISYPFLWNAIDDESEIVTRLCLERLKSLPLIVSLSNFSGWSRSTRLLVGSHAGHIESLTLFGAVSYGLSEIFINLVSSGEPLLRDLTIICTQELRKSGRATRYGSLYSPILSKDIPTLCTLYLYSFPLTPQLSGLRHLTNVDLIDPGSTATNAILDLLANNPCLQWVNIQGPLYDQGSTREDQSVALPQLRHFLTYECEATEILRCLHLPRLGLFEIDMQYSFNRVPLPGAYQPYSVLQLARDFQFHDINLITSPEFCLKISMAPRKRLSPNLENYPRTLSKYLVPQPCNSSSAFVFGSAGMSTSQRL